MRRKNGFVLIFVLWVLAILTVMTLGFGRRALLDARSASYTLDEVQARAEAKGAVFRAIADMKQRQLMFSILGAAMTADPQNANLAGFAKQQENIFLPHDASNTYASAEAGGGNAPASAAPPPAQGAGGETAGSSESKDECGYRIEDEERRFNINTVPEQILDNIEILDFRTAEAIIERTRKNDEGDAEPFMAIEELLFLRGMEEETFTGEDGQPGLRDIFTVYGDGKVNINTASRAVLMGIPDIDEDSVDAIVAFLNGMDQKRYTADDQMVSSFDALQSELKLDPAVVTLLNQYCKTESEFYRIIGYSTRRNGRVRATCTAVCQIKGLANPKDEFVISMLDWKESVGGP